MSLKNENEGDNNSNAVCTHGIKVSGTMEAMLLVCDILCAITTLVKWCGVYRGV